MDSGEIVVSSIRAGMKREFAMMMKAQSEIGALPAGRRRMTRSQSTAGSSKGNVRSADKVSRKVKGSNVGDDLGGLEADFVVVQRREAEKVGAELREDMPRVRGTDGDSIQEAERPVGETSDLGMKMSEKVELNRIPTKLKDLLQTGLLEGLHVRYIHGSKGRSRPESELGGVIQGAGILCSCDECKEKKVVTPNQFEMHAGSGNKRPPQYIFLDNGNSLRDVLNACKANLSESLESVILNAIGRSNYTTAFCINCKELIPETGAGRSMLLCDSCVLAKESDAGDAQIIDASHSFCLCLVSMAGPSAPASSSRPPVVSESAQISSHSQPQAKRQGKLTRKDLRMHKSVLAEDVLPEGTALSYVVRGEVSPSQFEAHAGYASRRKPYMSIYTSNGVSLHQLSLELSKIRRSSTEEHDDLCSICEDGGDLLCCANCPRGFHTDANAIAAGRVPGVDPLEAITQRCIRVVATLEPEIGGCALCRRHDFCKTGFSARTIIILIR
ncbi:UNVERIFIED_CONTAM: Increased DNA methylation 1 [Sesamum radiatum]|uniref:Increased DNA methylation 1 n=1 Tax=Sesamum radiatum TaxID=300843 RepID=A0AAW2UPG8_SESRA